MKDLSKVQAKIGSENPASIIYRSTYCLYSGQRVPQVLHINLMKTELFLIMQLYNATLTEPNHYILTVKEQRRDL